jgi:hypothetical protein
MTTVERGFTRDQISIYSFSFYFNPAAHQPHHHCDIHHLKMPVHISRKDFTPIPVCQPNNMQEWRSRVIEAFAMNGMGDYLFNNSSLNVDKMAVGMAIILPSLPVGLRGYLTKIGYDFDAKLPDPRKLFTLGQQAAQKRDVTFQA